MSAEIHRPAFALIMDQTLHSLGARADHRPIVLAVSHMAHAVSPSSFKSLIDRIMRVA
ncbi:hypothetical protein [Azospirillum himalayense]|uniref:Uncharacterized protein n=1 Tax=Azospirillum himalayense TaxID=654847 RepID=A0ABW0G1Y9_9PROT